MNPAMLFDAVRAEAYRISRNWMLLIWSLLFVPVLYFGGGLIFHKVTQSKLDEAMTVLPAGLTHASINVGDALIKGVGLSANGAILVFMLIAAATLYAGDYRWETWRLITARNSRVNLILGKVGTFKGLALLAMLAFLIANLFLTIGQSIITDSPLTFSMDGEGVGQFVLVGLLAFIRIVQYAMIALLTAVLTRSLLATLFVPLVLGFTQSLIGGPGMVFLQWSPEDWIAQLVLPGLAYDTLKAVALGGSGGAVPDGVAIKSIVSLALWTLVPLAGAIAWFGRQDLSKE